MYYVYALTCSCKLVVYKSILPAVCGRLRIGSPTWPLIVLVLPLALVTRLPQPCPSAGHSTSSTSIFLLFYILFSWVVAFAAMSTGQATVRVSVRSIFIVYMGRLSHYGRNWFLAERHHKQPQIQEER